MQFESSNLVELLQQWAIAQPEKAIFTFLQDGEIESEHLTYYALDQKARIIAAHLQSLCSPGDRVLMLYPPGLDFVTGLCGCLYAGVVAVPLPLPKRRQSTRNRLPESWCAIASNAQATVALSTTTAIEQLKKQQQASETPTLRWVATNEIQAFPQCWEYHKTTPDTLALLQYTSGSTSTPKGVKVSHGNLLHNLKNIQTDFEHTPHSQGVIWLPPYHDMGLVGGLLQPLFAGFSVALMPPAAFLKKPVRWLQVISKYKATISGGPNFAYDLCVKSITPEQMQTLDLSSWEVAFTGAEPVQTATMAQFADKFAACGFRPDAFYPCYGMAETTLLVAGGHTYGNSRQVEAAALTEGQVVLCEEQETTASPIATKNIVSCGTPARDTEIIVVHTQTKSRCSDGEVGEIWVRGASVAQGYWNQPVATEQSFGACIANADENADEHPYFRTGDLGFLLAGELFVTGRSKDTIIIRGRNYYPQDIERVVEQSHPALGTGWSAAFSVEQTAEQTTAQNGMEQLVIISEVKRTARRRIDVEAVASAIRDAVYHECNLSVASVTLLNPGGLPKTSSGKVQRYACRTGFENKMLDILGHSICFDINCQPPNNSPISESNQSLQASNRQSSNGQPNNKQPTNEQRQISQEDFKYYLTQHLTKYLKIAPEDIETEVPFSDYGLDSSVALSLTGDLEEWLGIEIEPDVFWRYPSIDSLAEFFAEDE